MSSDLFSRGLEIRREVLGAEYVDNSLKNATEFSRPMQELSTEYCWGKCWGSGDLPNKTRSLINIAMISILNRQNELKLHIRGAVRNGCTKEEIRGALMQVAIYAGIPAGMDSFHTAVAVLDEIDAAAAAKE